MKHVRIPLLSVFVFLGLACGRSDRAATIVDDRSSEASAAPAAIDRRVRPNRDLSDADRPRAMIVSIDGLRPDAISAERTPILQSLIDGGSYHPRGQAQIPSSTLPNHSSMITGLSVLNHGVIFNSDRDGRIIKPTIIDAARAAGLRAGFFASKTKFRYLCNQGEADAWAIETDVDRITDAVIPALRNENLDLVFLHYGEPDGAGHKHGWMTDEYFVQVARVDTAFGRVLAALDAAGLRDNTLIVLTSDHGGLGKSHGLPIPEHVDVPFILNGPTIATGRALDTGPYAMASPTRPMDAAANALAALGISIDGFSLDANGVGGVNGIDGRVTLEARTDYIPADLATPLVFGLPCGPLPPVMLLAMPMALLGMRKTARAFCLFKKKQRGTGVRRCLLRVL